MPHQCTNCGYVFADGSKEMLTGCPGCNGNKFQYHPGEVPDQPTQDEPPERPGESGVTGTVGKAAAKVRDLVGDDEPDRAHPQTTTDTASHTQTATDSTSQPADQPAAATETTSTGDQSPPETASADSASGTNTASTASTSPSESTTADSATDEALTDESARDSEEVPDRDDEDAAQQSARSEMVSENDLPPASERPPSPDRGRVVSEPDSDERPDMDALREELNSQFESIRIVSPGKYELNLMELYDREEYIIALQENGRYVIEVPDAWEVENADETE